MLTMLGIPNCDTVRKARRFLEDRGIAYTFRDLRKEPLAADDWATLLAEDRDGRLINTRGPSFRKAGIPREALTPENAVALLCEHPTAMKRPVMLRDERLESIGFSEDDFTARFS